MPFRGQACRAKIMSFRGKLTASADQNVNQLRK